VHALRNGAEEPRGHEEVGTDTYQTSVNRRESHFCARSSSAGSNPWTRTSDRDRFEPDALEVSQWRKHGEHVTVQVLRLGVSSASLGWVNIQNRTPSAAQLPRILGNRCPSATRTGAAESRDRNERLVERVVRERRGLRLAFGAQGGGSWPASSWAHSTPQQRLFETSAATLRR
jgi:hypothetical protein